MYHCVHSLPFPRSACISLVSRLPVSHIILDIPCVCLHPVSIYIYPFCSRSSVSRCIQLYSAVSVRI